MKHVLFGYQLASDNQIDYDRLDRSLFQAIKQAEPTVALCMACGSCSATCTAAPYNGFSFRSVVLLLSRGITDKLQNELANCMLCGKCQLVCPRGVNTRNVILQASKLILQSASITP